MRKIYNTMSGKIRMVGDNVESKKVASVMKIFKSSGKITRNERGKRQ